VVGVYWNTQANPLDERNGSFDTCPLRSGSVTLTNVLIHLKRETHEKRMYLMRKSTPFLIGFLLGAIECAWCIFIAVAGSRYLFADPYAFTGEMGGVVQGVFIVSFMAVLWLALIMLAAACLRRSRPFAYGLAFPLLFVCLFTVGYCTLGNYLLSIGNCTPSSIDIVGSCTGTTSNFLDSERVLALLGTIAPLLLILLMLKGRILTLFHRPNAQVAITH
jgi:hypothetical protein